MPRKDSALGQRVGKGQNQGETNRAPGPDPQSLTNSNCCPENSNPIQNGAPGFPNSSCVRGPGSGAQLALTSDST